MFSHLLSRADGRAGLVGRYALSFLTLRFADPAIERAYVHYDLTRALPLVRLTLGFAILVYASFGILDYHVAGDSLFAVWALRFGVVCGVMAGGLASTFHNRIFIRHAQTILGFCMTTAGLGIIAMTAVLPEPASSFYYAGLILVVIYGSTLVRLRFLNSALISAFLLCAYQVSALVVQPIGTTTLIANNFFLVVATGLGLFGSYIQELYVRQNFVSTQLLIDEKNRSQDLLARSEAASHAKSEFLAVVSHELRTPLNAIIGFSEFVKLEVMGPIGNERYRGYVEDIYNSGQHLLQIINDILDLSRAEANKLELQEEIFDLVETIQTTLRMFRNKAAEEGTRLSAEFQISPQIRGDRRLVRQVITNLLSNALKFTPRGGAVHVALKPKGKGVDLLVQDDGIGIAPDDIQRVLEPFVQVEGATARSHEGLGLGLPLVKRIMELHAGSVEIDSVPGRGTAVAIHFPADRVMPPEPTKMPEKTNRPPFVGSRAS